MTTAITQKKRKDFDLEFLGYMEGTIVNGELVFKDILVNVKGKFTFKYTQQGAVWVVPAYFYVEAEASIGFSTQWARALADKEVPLDLGFILDIEPELKIGGGAGVKKAVSAGIWGKGTLPYSNNFSKQHHTLSLKGEFGVEAEFFILKGNLTLLDGELEIINSYYGSAAKTRSMRQALTAQPNESAAISLISRDYAEDTSEWLGAMPRMRLMDNNIPMGVTFRDLQTSVYASSQAQVVELGDDLLMVWVEDDTTRDEYNRMRLVYSVYNSDFNTWSKPQPVADDGRNDGYPSLVSDGTNAYVVWQKIDKVLTAEDCTSLDALLENSELYIAEFDPNSNAFNESVKLTDNGIYEYAAIARIENSLPVVYYAAVEDNDLNGVGNTTLYRQEMSGEPEVIEDSLNYIVSVDAADNEVSYVMDADGDTSTTNDITVYTLDGDAFNKEGNDVAYSVALYGNLDGETKLFTSDLSNIYYMENGKVKSVFEDPRSITGNINIAETIAGTTIVWTENVEGWNELYAVRYEDGAWTDPVQISQKGEALSYVDTAVLSGKLVGVCSATAMGYDEAEEQYVKGATDLCFFMAEDFTDIALSEYVSFDETTLVPGEEQEFEVMVTNNGTTNVSQITFTIADDLGSKQTITKSVNLTSGSNQMVTLSYLVPENYAKTDLKITAALQNLYDVNEADNTVTLNIGKPDLSISETGKINFGENYLISAVVENGSVIDSENVQVSVFANDLDSEPLNTETIGDLDRNTYAAVDVMINADDVEFDENGTAKVYLVVTSDAEDAADGDNKICVLLVREEETECAHPVTESANKHTVICSACGETVSETDHSWDEGVVTKEPTENSIGIKTYTCTVCGETKTEDIPTLDHVHSYKETLTAPTCTEQGYTTYTCACGDSYVDSYVNALGHTKQTIAGEDATCTETGLTEGVKCSVCEETLTEQETIPANGHSWSEWEVYTEATYEAPGEERRTCSNCDEYESRATAMLSGWALQDNIWYYYKDGSAQTGWQYVDGIWYYFGTNGAMQTGWLQVEGTWYYLSSGGAMQTDWQQIGGAWYYFNTSGAMQTGWLKPGNTWYYLTSSGAMATGWVNDGGTWYYFSSGGAMQTGWQQIGGTWYYFSSSGAMQTGWHYIGGKCYYFSPSGAMQTGWQQIDGTWYYFSSSGAMQTGWHYIGGKCYYFTPGGAMVTGNYTVDGKKYTFSSSGVWLG